MKHHLHTPAAWLLSLCFAANALSAAANSGLCTSEFYSCTQDCDEVIRKERATQESIGRLQKLSSQTMAALSASRELLSNFDNRARNCKASCESTKNTCVRNAQAQERKLQQEQLQIQRSQVDAIINSQGAGSSQGTTQGAANPSGALDKVTKWLADGWDLYQAKNYVEALDYFQASIKAQPKNADAHYWAMKSYQGLKQTDKAKEHAAVFVELLPDDPRAMATNRQYPRLAQFKKDEAEMSPGKVFKDCDTCATMVVIPSGNGIGSFALSQTEVTQGQWQAVMGNNPSHFKSCGADCPVEQVSWDDAQEFIKKLNVKTGKTYRLSTEQEWEYACLAGQKTDYCGGNDVNALAWIDANSNNITHAAKGKQANAFGLYDMGGNVNEWTDSCHLNYCAQRVIRGGSWNDFPQDARAAGRDWHATSFRSRVLGFRIARTAP